MSVADVEPQDALDQLPDRGVRSRSGHARRIHRIDEDADGLRPACCERDRQDRGWKDVDPARLLGFERFTLCRNGPCFPDLADAGDPPLIADGGAHQCRRCDRLHHTRQKAIECCSRDDGDEYDREKPLLPDGGRVIGHVRRTLEQLRVIEADDDLDDDLQERARDRREELQAETGIDVAPPDQWDQVVERREVGDDRVVNDVEEGSA